MKHFGLKLTAAIMIVVGFFLLLGWAGDYDWAEQVVLHMTQEEYDHVKDTLTKLNGDEPSQRQIAHWWADHHTE